MCEFKRTNTNGPLISIHQFCTGYAVGRTRAHELIKSGVIEAVKIGASTRIIAASAEAWVASLPRVKATENAQHPDNDQDDDGKE